jgi:hypothetical protein
VLYTTGPASNVANYFADFHKLFPKISPNFIRLQTGAPYARTPAERQAHANLVDVLAIADVPPPEGGIPIAQFNILAPADWDAFLKTHTQFVREWDRMVGMR